MRKVLFLVSIFAGLNAFSAYGPAGCGLGAMVLEGKSGVVWNVLAATLNGSSANQTFGMSTGTLGCDADTKIAGGAINFIEANKVALANDVAKGNGETLASLGKIYNCSEMNKMGSVLQANYEKVFKSAEARSIHESISSLIVENKACI